MHHPGRITQKVGTTPPIKRVWLSAVGSLLILSGLACGILESGRPIDDRDVAFITRLPTLTPTSLAAFTPAQVDTAAASLSTVLPSPLPAPSTTPPETSSATFTTAGPSAETTAALHPDPLEEPSPVATGAVPALAASSGEWTFRGVQVYTDRYEDGLLLYGDVINNTGAAQELDFITGVFYDAQGQVIAGAEIVDAYWPIEVIPSGGSAPFELTVDGVRDTTTFELGVEAQPSDQNPHQDFELLDLNQSNEAGKYCITGQIRNLGQAVQEYLIIAVVLYDSQGNIVNFSPYQEPNFENLIGDQTLDVDICIGFSDQSIADYDLRAWGQ